ncbi:hypothetical protein CAEBREN_00002 [Caenorhabditis brenneri]|uniref:Uncharacterized protein n=1 Tax=Caenorhabditis brenneri TaxID=135651 RepID=G0MEQ0_CAEBE|nr:hypothetical protein CAEBREN_00002 [Caenorhabditis brenneri]
MRKQNRPNQTARKQMPNVTVELFARDKNACRPSLDETFLNSPTASSEQPAAISPTSEPIQELVQVFLAPEPLKPSHRKPRSPLITPKPKSFPKKPTDVKPLKSDEPESVESTENVPSEESEPINGVHVEPSDIDKKLINVLLTAWIKEAKQYNMYSLMKTKGVHDTKIVNACIKRIKADLEKEKYERKEYLRCLSNDQLECLVFHIRSTASKIEVSKGTVLAADWTIEEVAGVAYKKSLHVGRPRKDENCSPSAIQPEKPPKSPEKPPKDVDIESSIQNELQRTKDMLKHMTILHDANKVELNSQETKLEEVIEENAKLKWELEKANMELKRMRNMENSWKNTEKMLISLRDRYAPPAIPSQPHHAHPSEPMSFAACVRKQPSIESMSISPSPYAKLL